MKRFHVHVGVKDLKESTRFYSAMFGVEPTVVKPDYAKWMLDDPRVNFAISQRNQAVGINHLGVQAETDDELEVIHANLQRADRAVVAEKGVSCCYAKSDKVLGHRSAGSCVGKLSVTGYGARIRRGKSQRSRCLRQ